MSGYGQPDLMQRVSELEKRVQQLSMSPRTGLFRCASHTMFEAVSLVTNQTSVWSDFTDEGPMLEIATGRRALVLFTGTPAILSGNAWDRLDLSVKITHIMSDMDVEMDEDMLEIDAGDSVDHVRTVTASIAPASGINFSEGTLTGVIVEEHLFPGYNQFMMQGRHMISSGAGSKPLVSRRGISVIPLDL